MLPTQSIAVRNQVIPGNYPYGEQRFLKTYQNVNDAYFPFVHPQQEFSWAEQVYRAGEMVALVATYNNIPLDLKKQADRLIAAGYCKSLFTAPLYKASLLLLSSGAFPNLKSLVERSKEVYARYCATEERQRASNFVSRRKADDIVVLVLRSGVLVGSMTLFPFSNKEEIPSLSYLTLGSAYEQLPNVPALEVGRLAKARFSANQDGGSSTDLFNSLWITAAFLVARDFVTKNGLLNHPDSFVCGDTYGSLLARLQNFFPLEVIKSSMRSDILDEKRGVRDVAIYFLQRQVLGSFKTTNELISTINKIGASNPEAANQIVKLMETGLNAQSIKSLREFNPQKFRVHFFYFPFHNSKTKAGLRRLEKIILKLTSPRSVSLH